MSSWWWSLMLHHQLIPPLPFIKRRSEDEVACELAIE
jgi:hypothetical protein